MGKRLIPQRRGRGTSLYRSPSHRHVDDVRLPALSEGTAVIKDLIQAPGRTCPLAVLDLNGGIRLNAITLYAGYLRRNHSLFDYYWTDHLRDSLLYGGFVHHLCDAFDWSAYIRYNLYYSDLEEIGGYFQYNLDCLSFRLTLDYLPRYYSEDGWKHGSDFRISFGAWIRAFPRDDDEDWMTWGSLANEHALQEPET